MALPDSREHELSPHDVWEQLSEAAERGDEPSFNELLAELKRRNLDQKIIDSCLISAIDGNRADSVRQLMSHGANPRQAVAHLHEKRVSTDIWQALLDHGWNINSHDSYGDPIVFAFLFDPSIDPLLPWFLDHGASLEALSREDINAVSFAAGYSPVSVLRFLLEHGAGVDRRRLANSNAMHVAARGQALDRTEAMKLLVDEMGADVNARSTFARGYPRGGQPNGSPLHYAVRAEKREHVRCLLEKGAKVTEKDAKGRDVKAWAIWAGCESAWTMVEEWYAEKGLEMPEGVGFIEDEEDEREAQSEGTSASTGG